ncbi:MAG: DUF2207 domain-containing protein [Prevotella sp.]|nr:DUF2207 domain-containing protein [Prevotella sp.]
MRYRITLLLLLMVALTTGEALGSVVKSLNVNACLHKDGSCTIEEHWVIDLDSEDAKTEWYVAHKLIDGITLTGLTVEGFVPGQEGLVPFVTLSHWDLDASRQEKAGKCGLANGGQEVCWGFGDYGEHEYIVRYTLGHLVKSYDTCDGFNHCFVDMNCPVEQAQVTITAADSIALSEENTRRWAFGYEGAVVFEGNSVVATPEGVLDPGGRITVMLEMDKGMFAPDSQADESWADRKQRALDGSDYGDDDDLSFWEWVVLILLCLLALVAYLLQDFIVEIVLMVCWTLLCALWWVVSLSPLRTWRRRKKLGIAEGRYFRSVKSEWTLVQNKMVVDELSYLFGMSDDRIISAVLLRLMAKGYVTVVREEWKGKQRDMLRIVTPTDHVDSSSEGDGRLMSHALKLLTLASGDDLVLQPDEFKKWCKQKKNRSYLRAFVSLLKPKSDQKYLERNAADLFGMKQFLNDFTLLNERATMEVHLWDEYMVYAAFFGLTDKVRAEMKKICPEYLEMSKLGQSLEVAREKDIVYMFSSSIYSSASSAAERATSRSRSSSGYRSSSSRSGGGGSSGGGGGGGR